MAGLILFAGILLRWISLDDTSIWYDEAFTWWVALQSPSRIIEIIRADTWPPLYYLMMHVWIGLFGDSTWALRAQSALASTMALVLASALVWQVFKLPWTRLLSLSLIAVSVPQIEFAQDVRCYATASMLVLATLWCIVGRIQQGGRLWLIGYSVAATALVYQHNIMWFYLASLHAAWLLWPGGQRARSRWRDMLVGDTLVALMFAPWAPSLLAQIRHLDASFWTDRPVFYELTLVVNGAFGCHTELARDFAAQFVGLPDHADRLIRLPLFALLVGMCGLAVVAVRGEARRRVMALMIAGLAPIMAAFIYSQFRRSVFVDRCFTPSSLLLPVVRE